MNLGIFGQENVFTKALASRPSESGRTRPSVRIRPNSNLGRPPESGRTRIWDSRPNPAELRLGTAARIRQKNTQNTHNQQSKRHTYTVFLGPWVQRFGILCPTAGVAILMKLTLMPVRPNPAEPARPSESGRTRIWDGRPNPAELRFGTAVRIRPNSDWGRPPESGRKTHRT